MDIASALTLDQLRVLIAVEEEGSFSAAARRLNRTQPAITYTVDRLEDLLGASLLDRTGYRPRLSDIGKALLPKAIQIVEAADQFAEMARSLARGVEGRISLVVDGMFPMERLMGTIERFRVRWIGTELRILVQNLSASLPLLLDDDSAIGLVSRPILQGVPVDALGEFKVELVMVAAADHELAQAPVSPDDLRLHPQIVLTDRHIADDRREFGVLSSARCYTSDLGAKLAMIAGGLGWGTLPAHMADAPLRAGTLRAIELTSGVSRRTLVIDAVRRRGAPAGPAMAWLCDEMTALAGRQS